MRYSAALPQASRKPEHIFRSVLSCAKYLSTPYEITNGTPDICTSAYLDKYNPGLGSDWSHMNHHIATGMETPATYRAFRKSDHRLRSILLQTSRPPSYWADHFSALRNTSEGNLRRMRTRVTRLPSQWPPWLNPGQVSRDTLCFGWHTECFESYLMAIIRIIFQRRRPLNIANMRSLRQGAGITCTI